MKYSIIFLSLFLCQACEPTDCDFRLSNICFISQHPIDAQQLETLISITEEELLKQYPNTIPFSKSVEEGNITVRTTDKALAVNCRPFRTDNEFRLGYDLYECEMYVDGMAIDGEYLDIVYSPCLKKTALSHELLHSFEYYNMSSGPTVDHSTPWLFYQFADRNDLARTDVVEGKIYSRLGKETNCLQGEKR